MPVSAAATSESVQGHCCELGDGVTGLVASPRFMAKSHSFNVMALWKSTEIDFKMLSGPRTPFRAAVPMSLVALLDLSVGVSP